MKSTDFSRAASSVQEMDPTAVFVHHDRRCQSIADRTWQKMNIDRVSHCSFDQSGRFCAFYYGFNAIELWDFTSVPVPMTTLVLPKLASGRFDGFCHSLEWSPCNTFLLGVFGSRSINHRKAAEASQTALEEGPTPLVYRPYQLVVWNLKQRVVTHMFRLPFGVKSINPLPMLPVSSRYLITSGYGNCVFELNLVDSTITQLTVDPSSLTTLLTSAPSTLYNAFASENMASEQVVTPHDVPIDAFAAWWYDKCDAFNETHVYRIDSVPTSAVHVDHTKCTLYMTYTDPTNPLVVIGLCSLLILQDIYTILHTTTLSLNCAVLTITTDPHNTMVCVTSTAGTVYLYTTTLALLGEQLPTDREITDLLNANSNTIANTKNGTSRTLTLDHKKSLPVVYSANTEYKCTGVSFYTYAVPYNTDNTRYSNNLTHHDLLYPDTTNNTNSTNTTNTTNITTTTTGTNTSTTSRTTHRTGILYNVQGHSRSSSTSLKNQYSEHLILFDIDLTTSTVDTTSTDLSTNSGDVVIKTELSLDTYANTSNTTANTTTNTTTNTSTRKFLVGGVVGATLPKATTVEFVVSPLQRSALYNAYNTPTTHSGHTTHAAIHTNSAGTNSSSTSTNANTLLHTATYNHISTTTALHPRALPRQYILSIDDLGRLWCLKPHYSSDFPGPMYPIGYTLVTKVVQYVETEAELDVVVGSSGNSSGGSGSGSGGTAHSSATSLVTSNSGSGGSGDEHVAKRAKIESANSISNIATDSDNTMRGGSVIDLVLHRTPDSNPHTNSTCIINTTATEVGDALPFTFADDYLRVPANSGGDSGISNSNSTSTSTGASTGGASGASSGKPGRPSNASRQASGGMSSVRSVGSGIGGVGRMLGSPVQLRREQSVGSTSGVGGNSGNSGNSTSVGNSVSFDVVGVSGAGNSGEGALTDITAASIIDTSATNTTSTTDTTESMDVVVPDSTTTDLTTTTIDNTITLNTPNTTPWSLDDFLAPPVRIASGDFALKLLRNSTTSDALLHSLSDTTRVHAKLQQIVEEAVHSAVHAEEMKERVRGRAAAKKAQKELERAQEKAIIEEQQRREREARKAAIRAGLSGGGGIGIGSGGGSGSGGGGGGGGMIGSVSIVRNTTTNLMHAMSAISATNTTNTTINTSPGTNITNNTTHPSYIPNPLQLQLQTEMHKTGKAIRAAAPNAEHNEYAVRVAAVAQMNKRYLNRFVFSIAADGKISVSKANMGGSVDSNASGGSVSSMDGSNGSIGTGVVSNVGGSAVSGVANDTVGVVGSGSNGIDGVRPGMYIPTSIVTNFPTNPNNRVPITPPQVLNGVNTTNTTSTVPINTSNTIHTNTNNTIPTHYNPMTGKALPSALTPLRTTNSSTFSPSSTTIATNVGSTNSVSKHSTSVLPPLHTVVEVVPALPPTPPVPTVTSNVPTTVPVVHAAPVAPVVPVVAPAQSLTEMLSDMLNGAVSTGSYSDTVYTGVANNTSVRDSSAE